MAAGIQDAARHLAEGRPEEAASVLERLVEDFPAYVTAHVLLAKAYEAQRRRSEALEAWHRAYFLMPGSTLIVRERGRLLKTVIEPEAVEPEAVESEAVESEAVESEAVESEAVAGDGSDSPAPEAAMAVHPGGDLPEASAPPAEAELPAEPEAPEVQEPELEGPEDVWDAPAPDEQPEAAWAVDVLDLEAEEVAEPEDTSAGGEIVEESPASDAASGELEEPAGWEDEEDWQILGEIEAPPSLEADEPAEAIIQGPLDAPPPKPFEPELEADEATFRDVEEAEPTEAPESAEEAGAELDDLDDLILQLENAPRIRPDPDFVDDGSSVEEKEDGEVVSETLARIYEAQRQFDAAARAYEQLAAQRPGRATELLAKAAEMRRRAAEE